MKKNIGIEVDVKTSEPVEAEKAVASKNKEETSAKQDKKITEKKEVKKSDNLK